MVQIYTRQLGAIGLADGSSTTIYQNLSTTPVVLRDLVVANPNASTPNVNIWIAQTGFAFYLYLAWPMTGTSTSHLELRQVIVPGAALVGLASLAGVTVLATGYVFPT